MINTIIHYLVTFVTSMPEKIMLLSSERDTEESSCLGRTGSSFLTFFLVSRHLPVLYSFEVVNKIYLGGQRQPAVLPALPGFECQVNEMRHGPSFVGRVVIVQREWVKDVGTTRTGDVPVWETVQSWIPCSG